VNILDISYYHKNISLPNQTQKENAHRVHFWSGIGILNMILFFVTQSFTEFSQSFTKKIKLSETL
jgi:hypothetical protein